MRCGELHDKHNLLPSINIYFTVSTISCHFPEVPPQSDSHKLLGTGFDPVGQEPCLRYTPWQDSP